MSPVRQSSTTTEPDSSPKATGSIGLKPGIDGEAQRIAAPVGLGGELAHQLAAGGDLDAPRSGLPRSLCSIVFSSPSLPILKPA
jgi:hypothetical protein